MLKKIGITLFVLFLFPQILSADEIVLKNGDKITGSLINEYSGKVIFKSEILGSLVISRADIEKLTVLENKAKDIAGESEEKKSKPKWTAEIEGGYTLERGNTKSEGASGKVFINRNREKVDEWTLKGKGSYSSDDEGMDKRKYYGLGRYAWSFGAKKKWYHFTKIELDHDYFSNIRTRYTPATGIGYWMSDKTPVKALLEGGLGIERTDFRNATKSTTELILSSRAYIEWHIAERIILSEEFVFYPALTDFGEFRFVSESAAKIPLFSGLSIKFYLLDEYQSAPGLDTKKNDLRLESALAYSF